MQHSAVACRHGVLLHPVFTAACQKTPEAPSGRCSKMSSQTHCTLYANVLYSKIKSAQWHVVDSFLIVSCSVMNSVKMINSVSSPHKILRLAFFFPVCKTTINKNLLHFLYRCFTLKAVQWLNEHDESLSWQDFIVKNY